MESGGNGWVYTDADILGMVAPLKFAADDRCAFSAAERVTLLTRKQRD